MKQTKEETNYKKGTENRRCGICTMFRAPNGCTDVLGRIDRNCVCKLFYRKKAKEEVDA